MRKWATIVAVAATAVWGFAAVRATAAVDVEDPATSVVGCDTVEVISTATANIVITLDNADDDWPTTITGRGTHLVARWPASKHERRWTITAFIGGKVYTEGGKIEC